MGELPMRKSQYCEKRYQIIMSPYNTLYLSSNLSKYFIVLFTVISINQHAALYNVYDFWKAGINKPYSAFIPSSA